MVLQRYKTFWDDMSNVTIKAIADRAKVSTATVDRVLHDRANVSQKTRQRVKEAVHELGFGRLSPRLAMTPHGRLRFLFLLPELDTGFVQALLRAIRVAQSAVTDAEILIEVERINLTDGSATIHHLQNVSKNDFDGVGLFAFDAPGVRSAIDEVIARGVPVVTLVSDVPTSQRVHYVGVDNLTAGRTAGRMMGKFLRGVAGKVGVIVGNPNIRDHVERLIGFRQIISHDYRSLTVLPEIVGNSVADANYEHLSDLMAKESDLVGVYSIAGGNSGVLRALQSTGPFPGPSGLPVTIMHELTSDTKNALRSGVIDAVINQDVGHMARSAVRQLTGAALGKSTNAEQEKIRIDIYVAENM